MLTGYYHIGSQRGRVPMQVRTGRLGSEGGMEGAGPNQRHMWFSPGLFEPIYIWIFQAWKVTIFTRQFQTIKRHAVLGQNLVELWVVKVLSPFRIWEFKWCKKIYIYITELIMSSFRHFTSFLIYFLTLSLLFLVTLCNWKWDSNSFLNQWENLECSIHELWSRV